MAKLHCAPHFVWSCSFPFYTNLFQSIRIVEHFQTEMIAFFLLGWRKRTIIQNHSQWYFVEEENAFMAVLYVCAVTTQTPVGY